MAARAGVQPCRNLWAARPSCSSLGFGRQIKGFEWEEMNSLLGRSCLSGMAGGARWSLEEGAGVFHFHWLLLGLRAKRQHLVLPGSLLLSLPARQSRWDLSACAMCVLGGYPWWLCPIPFPWEASNCCSNLIIQMPPSGEEPGDLFYKGQTDVNSFSTKISAPFPPSQRL